VPGFGVKTYTAMHTFLLLNKLDNSEISTFFSSNVFPEELIVDSILKFWGDQAFKSIVINGYISEASRMTDGKVILSKDTIEFYLIQVSDPLL
jgi:hypothetical protein